MSKDIKIDRINRNILIQLQSNARISNLDLAEKVALSPSACLKRTKQLEEEKYIRNYVMAVDLDKICINVQAYFDFRLSDLTPEVAKTFEKYIQKVPEIVDCLKVSGNMDYVSFVVCSSVEELNALTESLLSADLGITRIDTRIVMAKPKWYAGYPLEALTWK